MIGYVNLRALLGSKSKHEVSGDDGESLEEDSGLRRKVQVPYIQHTGVDKA